MPLVAAFWVSGCGDGGGGSDANVTISYDARISDGPVADAPLPDAPLPDAMGPDAGNPDAGTDAGPPPGEVTCVDMAGTEVCKLTSSQGCCQDALGDATCLAAGQTCNGALYSCDGKEDCASGFCCLVNGTATECRADGDACYNAGNSVQCHTAADCPSVAPLCCVTECSNQPC